MSVVVQDHDAATIIAIGADRVDYMIIDKIKRVANSAKNMQFNKSIIIDLTEVDSMSSMIMGSLIDLMKQLRQLGQRLILVGLRCRVREALEQTRLDQYFEIQDDTATAMNMLTTPAR